MKRQKSATLAKKFILKYNDDKKLWQSQGPLSLFW